MNRALPSISGTIISKLNIFAPFLGIFRRTAAKYNIIFAVITNTLAIIRLSDNSQGISLSGIKSAEAVHINNYTLALKDQLIGVDIAQAHQLGVGHRLVLLQRLGDISISFQVLILSIFLLAICRLPTLISALLPICTPLGFTR